MKIILLLLLCFLFGCNVFGQSEPENNTAAVGKISLARDDGKGEIGEETTTFFTNDFPIHCSVELNLTKPATIKMNFVAIEAQGLKPGKNIVTVSYKTNGKQDLVNFNASPNEVWAAGKYRVDILIDDKLAESQNFEIQKSSKTADQKITQPKSKSRQKIVQKMRKN